MSGDGVRFGVNLMPPLWAGEKPEAGPGLMAQRRRLLDRMAASGLDHVMVGDHVMFHGGIGNDGDDAADFFIGRYGRRAGSRRLAPDVQKIGPVGDELQ